MTKSSLSALMLFAIAGTAMAIDPIYTPWHNNLAIRGYDPVAYFLVNDAVEGSDDFEYEWNGAIWRFSSAINLKTFMQEPEKYAPQYGGYCAYAVAKNSTASIEPEQFAIIDGKLYLNYNKKIQQKWLENPENFILEADKNWPNLLED